MPTIQKWGSSLAVRIPSSLAKELDVKEGTPVEITTEEGALVVTVERRPRYRLKDLLKDCRPEQLHGEIDWGEDVGREVVD